MSYYSDVHRYYRVVVGMGDGGGASLFLICSSPSSSSGVDSSFAHEGIIHGRQEEWDPFSFSFFGISSLVGRVGPNKY